MKDYNKVMKEIYIKLIGKTLPDSLLSEIANKSQVNKKDVENCCLELVARVFGDGSDLTKTGILTRIKETCSNENLKELILKLGEKYNINAKQASAILGIVLPTFFKNVSALEDSDFVEEEVKPQVASTKSETTIDEIYKNIEAKAEKQQEVKPEKQHKHLFNKKAKVVETKQVDTNKEPVVDEKEGLSTIEKACMIVVLVSLIALVGVVVYMFIRQML